MLKYVWKLKEKGIVPKGYAEYVVLMVLKNVLDILNPSGFMPLAINAAM